MNGLFSDKVIKIEIRSNNTGKIGKVGYEGVIPRFYQLYLNRDISKLKKSFQDEILSHVCKATCKTCCGSGLNPKALQSKINGLNIVDYMNLPVSELLMTLPKIKDPVGVSIAK